MSARGRVVVVQQADGWWRWRFEPDAPGTEALISGETYQERDEAEHSAEEAYPGLRVEVVVRPADRHRWRTLLRRTAVTVVTVLVVLRAARAGIRHPSTSAGR